ncbi:MAG: hypothetical protein FGM27_06545 [Candidatus Omnitrophica bacterium]|nr:hypothetical protein [Candidatus Omnitrophota bacterium]
MDEKDCKIILHGKKMNRPKELLAERETEIGKVSLYRLPEFQKVTVGDLHLRHLDEGYRGLIPPIARSILLPQGIVIDLGHGFKTIRDRSDLKDKNNLMPVIEEAVRQMTLEAIVRLFSLKGLDVEVLPYDYFSHFASYPIPHRVEQDGRGIGENQPIDYSYYSNDESRFGMLLVSVPFIKIKGEKYSLHSVLQILHDPSHAEFSFTDLPSELQEVFQRKRFDQELSAAQGMETMRTRRDSPSRFRRSLNEFEDREIPSDADRSRYGAYLAYNQFMKETMREAYRLAFGSEKDVRISFYRSGDRSLGHALQGQTRIGRNLALFGNESAAWKRILDDAASTHEEYLFWKASLETNYHELVHLGEKPSEAADAVEAEWTHHPAFRAKELQVIESGLAGMNSLEIRRNETRRIFQGLGAISANLETFGAYLEGQSPRVRRSADRRSELRIDEDAWNAAADTVIEVLNPEATTKLGRSEARNIYEISTFDLDRFMDAILQRWAIRLKQGIGTEENLFVAKAALEESGKLIEHLRALRGSLPQGTITIGLRLTGRNNSSFLAQLFKVLQGESQNAEILAEAGTVKKLLTGEAAGNVAVRSVLPADWQRGFKALRSQQGVVPVALDDQFMNEKMEGMFNGASLNWGETKPQGMVHDFGELLFAAALVEMAKIFSDPKHKDELLRLKSDSKATAEYLRAQLLDRLAALDYPQDMFTYGENGYLTIQGVIANAFLEFKAELLINQAA